MRKSNFEHNIFKNSQKLLTLAFIISLSLITIASTYRLFKLQRSLNIPIAYEKAIEIVNEDADLKNLLEKHQKAFDECKSDAFLTVNPPNYVWQVKVTGYCYG